MLYPNIDPVAFHLLGWPVYWYGLMYLTGFLGGWALLAYRERLSPHGFSQQEISDMVFYVAITGIIGGRLGYILFYDWPVIFTDPIQILKTWQGGMSIHGGILGGFVGIWIAMRKFKRSFLEVTDFLVPAFPLGIGAGRIGNFINGELWGRVTDMPWGMVFPHAGPLARHPSQLYEFALEGVVLFLVFWIYAWRPRPLGVISGLFAISYGVFRIFAECFREPDVQIGYLYFGLTEGQLLSIPLILLGIGFLIFAYVHAKKSVSESA